MADRPNLLLIMTDQQRWDYVGYAGADFLRTPNLDAIARRGTVFTQCITTCPICVPARIGLATGLQAGRISPASNWNILPRSATTYYQRLRDAGYYVGCAGKLDFTKGLELQGRGDRPHNFVYGFTHPVEIEGKWNAGQRPTAFGPYSAYLAEKGWQPKLHADYRHRQKGHFAHAAYPSVLPEEDFQDTYIGRRAVEWIEQIPADNPWHLFVSFAGPHDPMDPPQRYADLYADADMPPAIPPDRDGKPAWLSRFGHYQPELTAAEIAHVRRHYCGAITAIDDAVGAIMAALERRGWAENTIVAFTSDHGESLGDHGLYEKQVAYEPSIRVPLAIAGPGLPAGAVSDALAELIDLNPTLCELAGLPPQEDLDARSLVPILRGEQTVIRDDAYTMMPSFHCLRNREWKYIDNVNDLPELYHLIEDPEERRNVAADHPDIVSKMRQRLRQRHRLGGWLR